MNLSVVLMPNMLVLSLVLNTRPMSIIHGNYCTRVKKHKSTKKGEFSKTAIENTWFERHKLGFNEVLLITYFFSQQTPYKQVQKEIKFLTKSTVSSETIADIYFYCREVIMCCLDEEFATEKMLGANGEQVQIDETKYGRRKYHRGKRVDGTWIFGAVEVGSDEIRLAIIPNNKRDAPTMLRLIEKFISKNAVVVSDKASFYARIKELGHKEYHVVNHSKEFKNSDGYHTNKIESYWRRSEKTFKARANKTSA